MESGRSPSSAAVRGYVQVYLPADGISPARSNVTTSDTISLRTSSLNRPTWFSNKSVFAVKSYPGRA